MYCGRYNLYEKVQCEGKSNYLASWNPNELRANI